MKRDIANILQAAGASVPDQTYSNDHTLIAFMEAWLGLTSSNADSTTTDIADIADVMMDTVEDIPLNDDVYQCIIDWLVHVWQPDTGTTGTGTASGGNTNTNTNTNTNLLLESQLSPEKISLDQVWDVVRAVRWIRHWMDLNVVDAAIGTAAAAAAASDTAAANGSTIASSAATSEAETEDSGVIAAAKAEKDGSNREARSACLSERLLQCGGGGGGGNSSSNANSNSSTALLQALFYHIQYLPVLQSQIDRYTTALQQQRPTTDTSGALTSTSTSTSTTLLATHDLATSRIQHYQRAQQVGARLSAEWADHLSRLETLVGEFYAHGSVPQRVVLRKCMGQTWSQFVRGQSSTHSSTGAGTGGTGAVTAASGATGGGLRLENTKAAGLKLTLHVLHRILLGVSNNTVLVPLGPAHQHLLFHQLIPLHRVEGMVLWRDQMAVLELYHEPLVQCIAVLLQKQPVWIPNVLTALLQTDIFPATGNTPKQVLLLHEIDTYLGLLDNDKVDWETLIQASNTSTASSSTSASTTATVLSGTAWIQSLLQVTSRCMASDHSRVSERALALFKNKQFEQLVQYKLEAALALLLPALVRTEPSWNPTVRKMTYHVLTKLQAYDAAVFERVSNRIFSAGPNVPFAVSATSPAPAAAAAAATSSLIPSRADQAVPPSGLSLKAGMGSWRPPSSAARSRRGAPGSTMPPPSIRPKSAQSQPPATVTGVAPWAHAPTPPPSAIPIPPGTGGASSKSPRLPPPSTVTGVAPWAMQPFPGATPPKTASTAHKRRAPGASLPPTTAEVDTDVSEESNGSEEAPPTGLKRVLAYMKKIQPPEEEEGVSTWSMAQMAETPTLLPKLKFHDLVFGHDLGAGAFGSVKYARLIERTKTRSHWAEYAVKVVSTEKIRELGYEASIQREIAVLRILSHPGIARLVSSFRFQEGAYLVLEYASGGDLHTLLRKHGSLDHDSTRFVIGEVVAALASIHDVGLVYADLKPENIVITETGHLKLTDFGGCRPVTEEAKEKTRLIAKGILKNLRDGNWKEQASKKAEDGDDPMDEDDVADHEEDSRIEGTTAYLPPEVVMGAFPTTTADSWALGCVLYQCLSGRPPLLEADEDATRNRIVSFDVHESTNQVDRLFQDTHASAISAVAKDLIKSLLERDPSKRPGMHQTAQHDFFTKADVDVFSLHRQPAYPLDVGDVSPSPDAQWARRQFSSIWAPQPVSYNISLPDEDATFTSYEMSRTGPIQEGEEVIGFFSTGASGHLPTKLGLITERAPMHSS